MSLDVVDDEVVEYDEFVLLVVELALLLKNLVEQAQSLDASITQQRNLLLRCQGAIEYLQQTGVTLPAPEPEEEVAGVEPTEPEVSVVE